jgi:oligoribonuclease (3'-5' exoribonuclease)
MGTHILDCVGLDISKDRILEIACIITDGKLTKQIEVAVEITYKSQCSYYQICFKEYSRIPMNYCSLESTFGDKSNI